MTSVAPNNCLQNTNAYTVPDPPACISETRANGRATLHEMATIRVRMLDGSAPPIAPLGPVWAPHVDVEELRELAALVSSCLEPQQVRNEVAHWIKERAPARRAEAKLADARRRERRAKAARVGTGMKSAVSKAVRARPLKISMPPKGASPEALYNAFARAAGTNTNPRVAYRFARQSVCAAEWVVDELVNREYLRCRDGEHAASAAHFESRLALREGEELDTLEKIHVVMNVRRRIACAPPDDAFDEVFANLSPELTDAEEDEDDGFDDHYWTPRDEANTTMLKVIASITLQTLRSLAEHFAPYHVGKALIAPGALSAFMDSVRRIVKGESKPRPGKPCVLGKPERLWFEALYDFSRAIDVVGAPDPLKQGARVKGQDGRYKKVAFGRAPRQIEHEFEAFRRQLRIGMYDLADEPHGRPGPGEHRLLDRLRADKRPVFWTAQRLRARRAKYAQAWTLSRLDSYPANIPFTVDMLVGESGKSHARVEDVLGSLIIEGRVARATHEHAYVRLL